MECVGWLPSSNASRPCLPPARLACRPRIRIPGAPVRTWIPADRVTELRLWIPSSEDPGDGIEMRPMTPMED